MADVLILIHDSPQFQKHLREVKLEFTAGIADHHLHALEDFQSLEALNLNGCQQYVPK